MLHRRTILSAAMLAALGGRVSAQPLTRTRGKLPPLPKASVEAAIAAPLTRYNRNLKGGAHTNMGANGGAPVVLSYAAFSGATEADARLLEQMRYTLTGGNDLSANGGYPAQHERNATAMFALARKTPRIWNQLTAEERAKVDLLMTAALIASAFTTSDQNPYVKAKTQQYALDGDSNLNRGWNPNYREGMIGMLVVAPVYFGGTDAVAALLDGFHHANFVQKLKAVNLSNLYETFTWKAAHPESPAPEGTVIETAVRNYRYMGTPVSETMTLYRLLTEDTYGKIVTCGLNNGAGVALPDGAKAGYLPTGCEGLPNKGKDGMLKELDSMDANGPRSSTLYAYDGFRVNLINQLVLVAGGLWKPGKEADACLTRLRVGIPDLFYKADHGYRNYAKGHTQEDLDRKGFVFTRPLWDDVLKPYHESV